MNDYNRGALPDPCLRLDYGFGEQWASVELGDGTGYVRLADYEKLESENAKLREEHDHYKALWEHAHVTDCELRRVRAAWKKDRDESAKLRKLCKEIWNDACHFDEFWDYVYDDGTIYREDELPHYQERMRELGIEVDDG